MSEHDKAATNTILAIIGALVLLAISFYFIAAAVTSDGGDDSGPNPRMTAKIQENIKPVGQVNVGAVTAVATAEASAEPRSGEAVYNASCLACHSTGVAGAPKVGDKAAWVTRAPKGADGMLSAVINGLNAMPPKGTCATCSDDELKAAIEYMLKESGV